MFGTASRSRKGSVAVGLISGDEVQASYAYQRVRKGNSVPGPIAGVDRKCAW